MASFDRVGKQFSLLLQYSDNEEFAADVFSFKYFSNSTLTSLAVETFTSLCAVNTVEYLDQMFCDSGTVSWEIHVAGNVTGSCSPSTYIKYTKNVKPFFMMLVLI